MFFNKREIYCVKRYKISEHLKKELLDSGYSLTKLCSILDFNVKNIYYNNMSISEVHLGKIENLLGKKFYLEEIEFDFTSNLCPYYLPRDIKDIEKSEDLAEFIGIMLGDGSILERNGCINISFDKRNNYYINYVFALCKMIFDVEFRRKDEKNNNGAHLYFYSKDMMAKLKSLGLKSGDKIKNNVGIPEWIKENEIYLKRCIKGLIDTDGCIYICKREKRKYTKFTNFCSKLIADFKEGVDKLGYHFAKANKRNFCLYRREEVARFINEIKPVKNIVGDVV